MEFNLIIYFAWGLTLGALLCFVLLRLYYSSKFTDRKILDNSVAEVNELQLKIAGLPSREEVERLNEELRKSTETILAITRESEQKISKEELERNYVDVKAFNIRSKESEELKNEVEQKNKFILELSTQLTELRKQEENLNDKLTTLREEIENIHKNSLKEFENIASSVIDDKSKTFKDTNRHEMTNVIDPLKEFLGDFKKKIEDTRKEDIQEITTLKGEIKSLQELNMKLSDDANRLAGALKSDVKMQGNWGEDRLRLILEMEGLQSHIDYDFQKRLADKEDDATKIPDFILNLPDKKHLIIDSKVSLNAYVSYFNENDPAKKKVFLANHISSILNHIEGLASRSYQFIEGLNSPDYVLMFMPVESALTIAVNENPGIIDRALKKKIVIITPSTLIATLKIIRLLWQREKRVANVEEIFKQCGLLYDKFAGFLEEMLKIENGLRAAQGAYRDAMDKLKDGKKRGDTIIGRFERIKQLEARTQKSIPSELISDAEYIELGPAAEEVEAPDDTENDSNNKNTEEE